jgi:hypothetical protein
MPRLINLSGKTFGSLTVLEDAGRANGAVLWRCKCACGGESLVRSYTLIGGAQKTCGCHGGKGNLHHGHAKRGKRSPEYTSWKGMKERCFNPNRPKWKHYGARGIRVCPEWVSSFDAFYSHVGPRPSPKHSIDRIDVDGHYEPGNVRWATSSEQIRNRRRRKAA